MKKLQGLFNIHPGEGRLVSLVLAYAIMLYFSNMMARTASMALFFGEYTAATLPYTYLFLMVIGPLVSFIYLRLNNHLSLGKVLLGIHGFLLLTLIILPLILTRVSAPVLMFTLPIYFGVNNSLTIASFWNLLGRIYNLRQGKRLFSLLSSGEHMATIVAGFMAPFLVASIGTVNLYWIGAFCMLITIVLLFVIGRQNAEKLENVATGKRDTQPQSGISTLLKDPYVRLIFALFSLFIIGIFMVGNISYAQAEIRYPSADEMAVFIGIFMGIFGVLSLIVQWFIAGRVLDRFGVRSMLMATPAGLFILLGLFALVGTFTNWTSAMFWLATGAAMWQAILDAVDSASVNIMYQPLPASLRTQAQTTVMGMIFPVSIGLAGLLLIILLDGLGFDSVQLSYATLVVIALWLYVAVRLGRAYPRRLRQALQARSFSGLPAARPDRASISVFEDALHSDHPAAVLYAMEMLQEVAPEKLRAQLPVLLAYPDSGVRIAALQRTAALPWAEAPQGVIRLLDEDGDGAVRAAALRTWYAVSRGAAAARLNGYSRDKDAQVQQAAVAMMRLHDDPAIRELAAATLTEMSGAVDAQERITAARVIAETAVHEQSSLLVALLNDPDTKVRRAALEAAAQARFPQTWAAILPALTQKETHAQAAAALAAGGEETLPLLEAACAGPDPDPQLLAGIAAVCGHIGGDRAAAILLNQIDHDDRLVRHQALVALSICGYQAPADARALIEAQLLREAQRSAGIVAAQVDVGEEEQVRLAAGALEQARQLEADNLLLLLSFLYEPQTVLSARQALQPGRDADEEKGAYAIEALDILLEHDQKLLLLPLLQELTPTERLAKEDKRAPQELLGRKGRLLTLLDTAQGEMIRWTCICALYSLGQLGDRDAAQAIMKTAAAHVDDPLLLETALYSLQQMDIPLDEIAGQQPLLQEAAAGWRARDRKSLTTMQKTELLKQVSIFAHLPDDVLRTIADLMVDVYAQPGQTVIRKGDEGDYLYVVVDGHLRVHDGDRTFDTLEAGGVAGEMALLDDEPRTASITAAAQSHLLHLDQDPFYALLAGEPDLARDLMGLLSMRLRERTLDLPQADAEQAALPVLPLVAGQPGMTSSVAIQGQLMDLDKVLALKRIELFAASDNRLLGEIAQLLEEVDLAGGEELFHQGDPGRSLYIVAAGQVRVHIEDMTLAYIGEGELLGEMALLESEKRLATVTAVVPSQLLRLDQAPFFELLEMQPALARGIITTLSARLRARLQLLAGTES